MSKRSNSLTEKFAMATKVLTLQTVLFIMDLSRLCPTPLEGAEIRRWICIFLNFGPGIVEIDLFHARE